MTSDVEASPVKKSLSLSSFAVPVVLFAVVVALGFLVQTGLLADADSAIFKALALAKATASDSLIAVTYAFTWIADGERRSILLALSVIWLFWKRERRLALVMLVFPVLAGVTSDILKVIFARPRPDLVPHLDSVSSMSFPSGHATNATALFLTMAFLLPVGSAKTRLALAIVLSLATCLSRVMLGVHWPTDVAAGAVLGLAFALAARAVAMRSH
jgi:undecaprenyl-diphosphatase